MRIPKDIIDDLSENEFVEPGADMQEYSLTKRVPEIKYDLERDEFTDPRYVGDH